MNAYTELKKLQGALKNYIDELNKYDSQISTKKVKARLNKIMEVK